ncbi:MAG TPA: SagB family peptide dehydrogenase [Euzebya sp.]|nr:SagB family peptide dehydrogenase [Euzebya sp.]
MVDAAAVRQAQGFHWSTALTEAAIAAMEDATVADAPQPVMAAPVDLRLPPGSTRTEAVALVEAMARRRTSRAPADSPLALDSLSWLLGHAAGARDDGGRPHPSALAIYPLRLDVVALRCDGLPGGVHRYEPDTHGLRTIASGDRSAAVATAFGRDWLRRARVVLVISADLAQATDHADARGYRYALLEAGHLAQNLLLLAAAVDLPACPLGGFADGALAQVVGAAGHEVVLYTVAL